MAASVKVICFLVGAGVVQTINTPPPVVKKVIRHATGSKKPVTRSREAPKTPERKVEAETTKVSLLDCPAIHSGSVGINDVINLPVIKDETKALDEDRGQEKDFYNRFPDVWQGPSIPNGMVPEPETWAYLVVGFGLVGLSVRKKPYTGKNAS